MHRHDVDRMILGGIYQCFHSFERASNVIDYKDFSSMSQNMNFLYIN